MDNMKVCPLLNSNPTRVVQIFCIKEECAWWNEERQKCAIAVTPPRR